MSGELYVQEDIQVAHRLTKLPGKCQQIHGHTMTVYMTLMVGRNGDGYAVDVHGAVLDFSAIKKTFRAWLGENLDHHVALNQNDPLFGQDAGWYNVLPGVTYWPGDPSVENLAMWICQAMQAEGFPVGNIQVQETATNGYTYNADPQPYIYPTWKD